MRKGVGFLVVLLSAAAPLLLAAPPVGSAIRESQKSKQGSWTLLPSLALASLSATELVYDDDIRPGYKLSQLDWSASVVCLLGVSAEWTRGRMRLRGGLWQSLLSSGGDMTDTDWSDESTTEWTDRTEHEAEVSILKWDVGAGWTILKKTSVEVDMLAGYSSDVFSWTDSGGSGIHTEDTFRDTPVDFEGTGIEYEQDMTMPYVGIYLLGRATPSVTLSGHLVYSPLVRIEAEDIHYGEGDGDTIAYDSFSGAQYLAVGAACNWRVSDRSSVRFGLSYQQVTQLKGESEIDGVAYEDGAGTDSSMVIGSLGVLYRL